MAGDYLTRINGVETLKEAAAISSGAADAGRLVRLNNLGQLDPSLGGGPGGGTAAVPRQITPQESGIYLLPSIPPFPAAVQVYVNGVRAIPTIDYTIGGLILTWTNPKYQLSASDALEVIY